MEDTASYRCLAKVSTTIFRLVSPRFVSSVLISSPTTIPHHRHKKTQNEERIFTKSYTYKTKGLVHLLENAISEEGHLVLVFCFCFFSSFDHLVLFPVSPPIISVLFTSFTNTHWFFFFSRSPILEVLYYPMVYSSYFSFTLSRVDLIWIFPFSPPTTSPPFPRLTIPSQTLFVIDILISQFLSVSLCLSVSLSLSLCVVLTKRERKITLVSFLLIFFLFFLCMSSNWFVSCRVVSLSLYRGLKNVLSVVLLHLIELIYSFSDRNCLMLERLVTIIRYQ